MATKASTARRGSGKRAAPAEEKRAADEGGLVLEPSKGARLIPGCGFGIRQSILLSAIDVRLPTDFDLSAIEPLLAEFALAPLDDVSGAEALGPEARVFGRIHVWQAAIQRGAGVPVFGACRAWERGAHKDDIQRIAFAVPSHRSAATKAALAFVVEAIAALAAPGADAATVLPKLREKFDVLWPTLLEHGLRGVNASRFADAAHQLGVAQVQLFERVYVLGQGRHRVIFNSSITSAASHLGVGFARDKFVCAGLLRAAGLPVAQHGRAVDAEAAVELAKDIGYPVVVKPGNADGGAGVTAGIEDEADLRKAFAAAAEISDRVMVEKHHFGADYRVTVVHGEPVKLMVRRAAGIDGDGIHTAAELVDQVNRDVRGVRAERLNRRSPLAIDDEALSLLGPRGYSGESVIPAGEFVPLRRRGNVSAGGTFEVLPVETLHPDNRALAAAAAATVGLDIAGIDIISGDPSQSWRETGGIICEVNASPQIGYRGSEDVYERILTKVLGGDGSIPVHLLLLQDGVALPRPLPELAAATHCNAVAWGTNGWVEGNGLLGPFPDVFRASQGILTNPAVTGALIAMTEAEIGQFGLPSGRFATIALVGERDWRPAPFVRGLVQGHAKRFARRNVASPSPESAA